MEKKHFSTVIFDFDYTLGDSSPGIALSVNYALSRLGREAAGLEEIKKTIGLNLKETYLALTGDESAENVEAFAAYFKEKADEVMTDNTVLYAGVKDMLAELRARGRKTAIVTTKYHYRIEQIFSKYGLEGAVDIIVGSDDVKVEKPDPEGLLWAIKALASGPYDTVYIGDSLVDAKTAENAGVSFIAVLTGATDEAMFREHKNLCICRDMSEVLQYILSPEE